MIRAKVCVNEGVVRKSHTTRTHFSAIIVKLWIRATNTHTNTTALRIDGNIEIDVSWLLFGHRVNVRRACVIRLNITVWFHSFENSETCWTTHFEHWNKRVFFHFEIEKRHNQKNMSVDWIFISGWDQETWFRAVFHIIKSSLKNIVKYLVFKRIEIEQQNTVRNRKWKRPGFSSSFFSILLFWHFHLIFLFLAKRKKRLINSKRTFKVRNKTRKELLFAVGKEKYAKNIQ